MKISLNWLKSYLDINQDAHKVAEILTDIGLEEEGIEEVESIKGGLEGIVIGHVKECGQHPNADKLSLTKVDVGAEELLQIVCGAPNVAAGQKVLVATVGTTLYTAEGEAWKIKKGKIRGEASHGMICAEDELGLGNDHSGIIVLPETVAVGTSAKDYYKVEKDTVYEIGLTPNRSDATSHIGVAKDLAAALKINYDSTANVQMPDVSSFTTDNNDLPVEVVVEDTVACPRYSGVSIKGITVGESPDWIKKRLAAIGVRSINNIVDATNFVLHELGQPLHAFDADKIAGKKVIVKKLANETEFDSLDEVTRKLHEEDLMICDGNEKGMCIAGVFGGINSGVTEQTTNVFLESAHFNAKMIRRTSTRHLLFTDAAKCYEKGSDPNITVYALKRAAMLIKELAGGEIASEIVDIYPEQILPKQVTVKYKNVSRLIGVDIPEAEIMTILDALEMEVVRKDEDAFVVAVPTNKADVIRDVDVIEEILRIYGFNKVPMPKQLRTSLINTKRPDKDQIQNTIADLLVANGLYETMSVSLTQSKYFKEILTNFEEKELVFINNTSNIHLDVMRPTMLFSGLETILHNQNRQMPNVKIFEFGKTYRTTEEGHQEEKCLSVFLTGMQEKESWLNDGKAKVHYYELKRLVENVLQRLGYAGYQQTAIKDATLSYGLKYHRGTQELVTFGKVDSGILKKMDIKQEVFYACFNWGNILKSLGKNKIGYTELSKFPSIRRDLALVIENSVNFEQIQGIAKKTGKKLLKAINLFDVYENEEQLGKGKKSYAVSFIFQDPSKTLKDKDIDKIMHNLIRNYEKDLGAVIRR